MTDLEVKFKEYKVSTGAGKKLAQQELLIDWRCTSEFPYYALKVESSNKQEIYLYRINMIENDEGDAIIPDPEHYSEGDYIVTLYGQSEYIAPEELPQFKDDLVELDSVPFFSTGVLEEPRLRQYGLSRSKRGGRTREATETASTKQLGGKRAISRSHERHRSNVIVNPELPELHRKYCGCLVEVGERSSPSCITGKGRSGTAGGGQRCASPYAICKSTVLRKNVSCFEHYRFDKMNDAELVTVALQHGFSLPDSWNGEGLSYQDRTALINQLERKQKMK